MIITGPDAVKLSEILKKECKGTQFILVKTNFETAESLIKITENMIEQKKEPLKDFDGPVYLRASEAEIKLNNAQ